MKDDNIALSRVLPSEDVELQSLLGATVSEEVKTYAKTLTGGGSVYDQMAWTLYSAQTLGVWGETLL